MSRRSLTVVSVLVGMVVLFLFCFTSQRREFGEIRDRINVARAAPKTPVSGKRKVLSAIGSSAEAKGSSLLGTLEIDLLLVPPESERIAFLKKMRSLINHEDSGMMTFISSKEYAQKIHSMNADTLKALLADLEVFQTGWMNKSMMKDNLLNRLVHLDPAFVLEVAHEGGNQMWGGPMMTAIRMIARSDPDEAIGWIERSTWEDVEWKHKLTGIYAQEIAKTNLLLALETIGQFQNHPDEFKSALRRIAIAANIPEQRRQIASYLNEIDDPEIRADVRATLVRGVFFREGFASATEAVEQWFEKGEGHRRNEMIEEIAAEALPDGQEREIADWVLRESSDDERASNIRVLVGDWVARDYNSAADWIGEIEMGAARNAAIEVLVKEVRSFDPDGAAAWAREIR